MPVVYVGHPASQYAGDAAELVGLCEQQPAEHGGWGIRAFKYANDSSLNAQDFCSVVRQAPGPVVLIKPVQTKTIELIRQKLGTRVPVVVVGVSAIEELRETLRSACEKHQSGEPYLALDVVVALLLMRKLDREHMWMGNAKGYMWVGDIPKGRGLDEKYEGRVPNVLGILFSRGLVVYKTSNSKKKYALNPERRNEIYDILRKREFPDEIQRVLLRHGAVESVRELDLLKHYEEPEG